jgi:hypothetical protein
MIMSVSAPKALPRFLQQPPRAGAAASVPAPGHLGDALAVTGARPLAAPPEVQRQLEALRAELQALAVQVARLDARLGPAPAAAARPAWCAPGDPSCDPMAPARRPAWCAPGDPSCDPAASPALLRPTWCAPGDPACDPGANPSLLRPAWCMPGDPSCDPAARRVPFGWPMR